MPLFGLSKSDVEKMEAKRDVECLIKALEYKRPIFTWSAKGEPDWSHPCHRKDVENALVRSSAALALGRIGDARAVDGLIAALRECFSSVRSAAAEALSKIGGEHAVEGLIALLNDKDGYTHSRVANLVPVDHLKDWYSSVRATAAEGLGKIGSAPAVFALTAALKDPEVKVRESAAGALGSMKLYRARVLPVLNNALSDADGGVREKAATAIYEFGRASYILTNISEEASNLVSEALKIIETQLSLERGFSVVVGAGDVGPVMVAAGKLEAAHKLHPENPLLHYAYASSLFLAMQYKSAREAMEDCAHSHPEFLLAQYAIKSWNYAEWKSLFLLPQWGSDTRILPLVISQTVKTQIVLPVREGIRPRAALFFRDAHGNFSDVEALQKTPIALATVISPVNNPQIVCVCAKICDNPSNPFIVESLHIPFYPYGHSARSTFEHFCLQEDMDVVIMDRQDRILLNKRVPFSSRMMKTNMNILAMLNSSEGRTISPMELTMAIQSHQRQVSLSDVQF